MASFGPAEGSELSPSSNKGRKCLLSDGLSRFADEGIYVMQEKSRNTKGHLQQPNPAVCLQVCKSTASHPPFLQGTS